MLPVVRSSNQDLIVAGRVLVQGSDEWLEARKRKLTTSRWGSVFGVSPFDGPQDVYDVFRGQSTFTGNLACDYGSKHEDTAIEAYVKAMNKQETSPIQVEETGLWINEKYDHGENFIYPPGPNPDVEVLRKEFLENGMGGSPDGLVYQEGRRIRVIEVKCPSSKLKPIPINKTPHYMFQCQGNMLMTGTTECDFIVWTPYGCKVWRIPLVSTMELMPDDLIEHEVVLHEAELTDLIRKDLYTDEARFKGYRRVLGHVLFEMYQECRRPGERTPKEWQRWLFQTSKERRWATRLNEIAMERAVLVHSEQREIRVPFRKINWPAMLSWQLRALEHHSFLNVTWGRFGIIANGEKILMDDKEYPARIVHAKTLFPDTIMPIGREGTFVYLDIFHPNKRGKWLVRPLELDIRETDVPVWYCKWHKKQELPLKGYYTLTVQQGTELIVTEVGEWNPTVTEGTFLMTFPEGSTLSFTHQIYHAFRLNRPKKRRLSEL